MDVVNKLKENIYTVSKEDKSCIQCLECYDRNIYIGTKDATVQHLILTSSTKGDMSVGLTKIREGRARKLGSSNSVTQLRAVPLFNHLLVLWDRSVTALNMFSLEPVPALKKIQHVSLFEVCDSSLTSQATCVQMVTSSSRRKVLLIHVVGVDRWEVVKEVSLLQDPVALAVDGATLCLATSDRYLLCDIQTGSCEELFPHNHSRQYVIVTSLGQGEFLLNGPEYLGMFVMKMGICQRPPLQWPQEVLGAGVCFPYILSLQPELLSVYSMLDQQRKQTVSLNGFVPILHGRVEEALLLLEGAQSHRPLDSYKELQKAITCLAGFAHFYQEGFSQARDLFIKGELDPREIIRLYPDICLSVDFQSHLDQINKGRDLQVLEKEDRNKFHRYLAFLGDFLRAVKGTEQGLKCSKEVDSTLLRLYIEMEDGEKLQQLVAFPNNCSLDLCVPLLEQSQRFFALGSLYESHGMLNDAIWVKITDGFYKDSSCSDVYGHIVRTLSQLRDKDTVWEFADLILQRNQETGVQIFTKRPPDGQFETPDVLTLLEKFPLALIFYLEYLIHDLNSEVESHHNRLALAYVTQMLQKEDETDSNVRVTRGKLQQLLWESKFYNISTVYDSIKSTTLHPEKAILLGRAGEHCQALQMLVHEEKDLQAAEAYCCRAVQDQGSQFRQVHLLTLLQIYLSSKDLTGAAVDLLNNHPQVFALEKVLQLLPESWSVQLVSQFLIGSLRENFHQRQMGRLQQALARAELLRHKVIWVMDKEQNCSVCQRDLTEPHFARNPQGELMHTGCMGHSAL
uniref:Si:ch211-266g18.9 n=1 Tax=Amphilophus citrinellus TaxID=61819 RepID=A0A3Q0SAW6_AMPCI